MYFIKKFHETVEFTNIPSQIKNKNDNNIYQETFHTNGL